MIGLNKRSATLFAIIILFSGILYKFFYLQVVEHEKFRERAFNRVVRKLPISAPRGIIKDRNGIVIVDNTNAYDFQLVPYDVKDNFNYKLLVHYVSGIDTAKIKDKVSSYKKSFDKKFTPIEFKNKIIKTTVDAMKEQIESFPGLVFSDIYTRKYNYNSNINLSHVLSEVKIHRETNFDARKNKITIVPEGGGVEAVYDYKLKGIPGLKYHLFDASGRDNGPYIGDLYKVKEPASGQDITLTIDIELQEFIYQIMQEFDQKKHEGTIILSNPNNGEILAYVNSPSFDIEKMLMGISQSELNELNQLNAPFLNRGINPYLSGSIIKIASSIMLLEEGFDGNTLYDCNERYVTHKRDTLVLDSKDKYRSCHANHKDSVSLKKAISESCNVYFWNTVKYNYKKIYRPNWYSWMKKMGFSSLTNIDLLYEKEADLNSHFAKSHMFNKSIGQGESKVTPIQVLQMINLIANDGFLVQPHFNKDLNAYKQSIGLKNSTISFIQDAMKEAVQTGTAKKSRINDVVIRAKTGTAELGRYKDMNNNGRGSKDDKYWLDKNKNGKVDEEEMVGEPQYKNAWYAGYMEYGKDKVSLVIFLEESSDQKQSGGLWASEMAQKIFEKYLILKEFRSE